MSGNCGYWYGKHKKILWTIVIAIIIGIGLVALELFFIDHNHFHSLAYLTAALVAATGILASVAYRELRSLSKISKSSMKQLEKISSIAKTDFLLRIDHRYGSEEILKARRLIAELKRDTELKHDNDGYLSKAFQNEMIKIRENKESDESYSIKYIELLNLLDFLETVAYFSKEGYIDSNQIVELFGSAIKGYQDIFSQWIRYFNYYESGEKKAKEEQDYPYYNYYENRKKKEKPNYPYFPDLMKVKKEKE